MDFFCLTVPKLLVEEPFSASKKFWYQKILRLRGGREYDELPSKWFVSPDRRKIVEDPFCVSENNWYPKTLRVRERKGVGLSLFSAEIDLSHGSETFRRRTLLRFRKLLLSKKVVDKRGLSQLSVDFFRLTVPKLLVEQTYSASDKILLSRNFEDKRREGVS